MLNTSRLFMKMSIKNQKQVHFINDYYLILIGSLTGLRVSEVAGLKIGDVGQATIRVVGKGNKLRSVPLGRKCRAAIDELLKLKTATLAQPTDQNDFLFLNRNRKQFTRFSINRRFDFWRRRCGIERQINWHSLRHYFATFLLNQGFLIHEVQRFLGHSSISTTSGYLHFTRQTQDRIDSVL